MKTMSAEEYGIVSKIARKTKADCWFLVKQDKNGNDYVHDLEEHKKYSLKTGITMLVECLDCKENYEHCSLSAEEEKIFEELLKKLNIEFDKEG